MRPIRLNQQIIRAVVGVEIALNLALRIQLKAVHAMADREVTDVIRHHTVQPASSIFTSEPDLRSSSQFGHATGGDKRLKFRPLRIQSTRRGLLGGSRFVFVHSRDHFDLDYSELGIRYLSSCVLDPADPSSPLRAGLGVRRYVG